MVYIKSYQKAKEIGVGTDVEVGLWMWMQDRSRLIESLSYLYNVQPPIIYYII